MDHQVLLFVIVLAGGAGLHFAQLHVLFKSLSRFRTCNPLFNKKKSPHKAVARACPSFHVWFWHFQVTGSRLSSSLTSVFICFPLIIWLISSPARTRSRSCCMSVPRGKLVCWTWGYFSIYSMLTFLSLQFTLWLYGFNFTSVGKKQKEPQMDSEEPCPSEHFVVIRGPSIWDSCGRLKNGTCWWANKTERQVSNVSITIIIEERWETLP